MKLTEKGANALRKAMANYQAGEEFSAAELTKKCGETISAAALNGVVNQGLMIKKAGSPVKFALVEGVEEMLTAEEAGGCDNKKMHAAKVGKNNEFYTSYEDIEKELMEYKKPRNQWRGKKILCNCNDGLESNFVKFFIDNFEVLGIERLTAINYVEGGKATKYVVDDDRNEDGFIDMNDVVTVELSGDGSFMSDESVEELKQCDIVVTNPPFSEFRDFIALLVEYNKDFLVLGNNNAITYKEIFPLIKDGKMRLGYSANKTMKFIMPDDYEGNNYNDKGQKIGKVPAITWFTTLRTRKSLEPLPLTATYYIDTNRREEYPKYDNYDAIEVSKVVNIPKDYFGVMGVPITFLDKFCPEQFEIIGQMANTHVDENNKGYPFIDGKRKYARILIKRIQN
jgi:hypothetical protein